MSPRSRVISRAVVAVAGIATAIAIGPAGDIDAVPGAPREHRVVVFSDSVGLGARHAIPAAFPVDWEVNVVGEPARFVEQLESGPCFWTLTNQRCDVKFRLAANPEWFGDHAVIAAGYNYPYWDPARFDRSIDSIVTTLTNSGVKHVYWVTLREVKPQYVSASAWRQVQPYFWYFPDVNEHLEEAVERHPNLTLVDWAAAADRTGLTYDAIHLNNEGAALYAELIRAAVTSTSTAVGNLSETRIAIPDSDGVNAVAVNITTTEPRRRGFLTASDCSKPRPIVSSHNFVRAQTVGHATIVPVGSDGEICIYASTSTNLVVDLIGRFTGDVAAGPSTRLLDTREAGAPIAPLTPIEVDVGSDATAVFTIATVGAAGPGWARVAPCDEITGASTANVNATGSSPTPNATIARPALDGTLCVMASMRTHLVLDRLTGFTEPSGIVVEPAKRVLDTRNGKPLAPGTTTRLSAAELGIGGDVDMTAGVLLNLTGTRSGRGWVAAFGCDDGPAGISSLNVSSTGSVGNFTVVAPDADGEVCFTSSTTTDLVVDLQGRTTAGFVADDLRLLDTRN